MHSRQEQADTVPRWAAGVPQGGGELAARVEAAVATAQAQLGVVDPPYWDLGSAARLQIPVKGSQRSDGWDSSVLVDGKPETATQSSGMDGASDVESCTMTAFIHASKRTL